MAAAQGANAAGRDVINSVALHADQATFLPAEAYAPIPNDAAASGLSNIPRTKLFVGRTAQLEALDAAFAAPGGVVLAVSGLGGVGKSSLVARWATTRASARVRWWVTADTSAALDAGLAALARALQPSLTQLPGELQTERAMQWLGSQGDWLLVLDNVDDPARIHPFIDRISGSGQVLVTTRRATGWHHLATTIPLDVFSPDESADLFIRILNVPHDPPNIDVSTLCAELGHLAMAVEQAASYCAETDTRASSYLRMLAESPAQMFVDTAEGGDLEKTIARTWRITLGRLTDTPLAGDILRILAWYGPEGIPRDVLSHLGPEPAVTKAVGRLIAYSMITSSAGTLFVHRLVQTVARTPDADDPHRHPSDVKRACTLATEALHKALSQVMNPGWLQRSQLLLSHVLALAEHSPAEEDIPAAVTLFDNAGKLLRYYGMTRAAAGLLRRVVIDRVRLHGEDAPETLISRHDLAGTYEAAGDLDNAITLWEDTLSDSVRTLGEGSILTVACTNSLAMAYKTRGDVERAITLLEPVVEYAMIVRGDDDATLTMQNNLALIYEESGDLERAIALLDQTLEESRWFRGRNHRHTLEVANNLAVAYKEAGDLGRAIRLLEENLEATTQALGDENPDSLSCRVNLAGAYEAAGELDQAISIYEQALVDYARVFPRDHPHIFLCRENLSGAYLAAGDVDRAIVIYEQLLADRERVLPEDHPDVFVSQHDLAYAYLVAGHLGQALPLLKRTLADRERALGQEHPDTLKSRYNLATAYWAAGERSRAIDLYQRVLPGYVRVLGEGHPRTRRAAATLARILEEREGSEVGPQGADSDGAE
ncbi:tetratricopeptide repeat protein [Streptomyces griseorubiginosus]|uniref:tetratricopeptide repeat protein n=1 Tax=Streptomyces griseorubiginosus TaxID=67304 RepID=UPI0033A641CB